MISLLVRLPQEMYDRVKRIADDEDRSMASVIRRALAYNEVAAADVNTGTLPPWMTFYHVRCLDCHRVNAEGPNDWSDEFRTCRHQRTITLYAMKERS